MLHVYHVRWVGEAAGRAPLWQSFTAAGSDAEGSSSTNSSRSSSSRWFYSRLDGTSKRPNNGSDGGLAVLALPTSGQGQLLS